MGKHKDPAQDDGHLPGKDGKPGPMKDPSRGGGKHSDDKKKKGK